MLKVSKSYNFWDLKSQQLRICFYGRQWEDNKSTVFICQWSDAFRKTVEKHQKPFWQFYTFLLLGLATFVHQELIVAVFISLFISTKAVCYNMQEQRIFQLNFWQIPMHVKQTQWIAW